MTRMNPKSMLLRLAFACLATIAFSHTSLAQETSKRKFVAQVKEGLQEFDSHASYTSSRCSLEGNTFSSNAIVRSRMSRTAVLELGDQVVGINGEDIAPVTSSALVDRLTRIPADAKVMVTVIRGGAPLELEVGCKDSLPSYTMIRGAYQAAADSDFKSCVSIVNQSEAQFGANSGARWLQLGCAYHAGYLKNPADWSMTYFRFLQQAIEEARWDPKEFVEIRGVVAANRQFFEYRQQLGLYQELQSQLSAAAETRPASTTTAPPQSAQKGGAVSTGTGFFVSPQGLVLTSAHVVSDAKKITVSTTSGMKAEARVVASSEATDLAVLQVSLQSNRYLSLAPPRTVAVGTPVFTYGWPVANILGSEPKFTDGTVSSLSGLGNEQSYLQISVPVQPGNSGGPLVDDRGQVVGVIASQAAVASFLRQTGTLPQNINWAVKAEYAALLADLPTRQTPAASRQDAIAWVRDAICFIEVSQ